MTVDTTRDELLSTLDELGRLFPDWRLGQMLANLAMAAGHAESGAVWDLEDSEAIMAARRLVDRHARRQAIEPNKTLESTVATQL
jgi:hypothetical protein